MNNAITFSQVDALLDKLGFEQSVVPDSHVNYRRRPAEAPLMVQIHKPKDPVPPYVLAYLRHELDSQGILPSARFETMLQTAAA